MIDVSLLAASPTLTLVLALVLGLAVGSFLNVVIHRLPQMMERQWQIEAAAIAGQEPAPLPPLSLARPRSRCPSCGHVLSVTENIPLLSWAIQRGKCRACGWSIPVRYPVVELATGLLSALAIHQYGPTVAGAGALALTWALIALAFIDLDTQFLPDDITLPLMWLGLLLNLWGVFVPLPAAVAGAMAGYLSLWSIYWLFKLATGREGMGYGDFKLLAAIGAWFGWQALPAVIVLASCVGASVGISLIVFYRHGREIPIPFGPYLAGAGLLTLYFGRQITAWIGIF